MVNYSGMSDDDLAAEIARLKAEIEERDKYYRDSEGDELVRPIIQSGIDLHFKEWEAAVDEKRRRAGFMSQK